MTAILHLDGVTKKYPQSNTLAIDNITFSLPQGDLLSILGPSGCGKTTLLRLIAGFERPLEGRIEIDQKIVAGQGFWIPPEKRQVGMVFQDYALFPHLTIYHNIAFGLSGAKVDQKKRVAEVISLVGLEGLENRYPYQLSGGQQQRVALARALAPQPSIILLDEPLSNLDVTVRLRLRYEIREILKKMESSAIFVTHDQEEALSISDWVVLMNEGKIQQFGTPQEVYYKPATRFVADFVAQANFLKANYTGSYWETEIGCFEIDSLSSELEGELMIRQEDIQLKPNEAGKLKIKDCQFLGRTYRYCLLTPSGQQLYAVTNYQPLIPVGTLVDLICDPMSVKVFPKKLNICT